MSIVRLAARLKTAAPEASLQLFQPVPGVPLALRTGEAPEERLPGMRRWVTRPMLERALAAQDGGVSFDDYAAAEDKRNLVQALLGGGALGAVAGYKLIPPAKASPLTAALMGSLGGGLLGAGAHRLRSSDIAADSNEAYHGAADEVRKYPRTALPNQRQDESSAAAVAPTLLHTGPSVVG